MGVRMASPRYKAAAQITPLAMAQLLILPPALRSGARVKIPLVSRTRRLYVLSTPVKRSLERYTGSVIAAM
jgi:hypothetical protein